MHLTTSGCSKALDTEPPSGGNKAPGTKDLMIINLMGLLGNFDAIPMSNYGLIGISFN